MRLKIAQIRSASQSLPFIAKENTELSWICVSQALTVMQARQRGGEKEEELRIRSEISCYRHISAKVSTGKFSSHVTILASTVTWPYSK